MSHFGMLERIRFAAGLPQQTLMQLQAIAELRTFAAGEVIFRENTDCDNVFLLASGQVALDMHVEGRGQVRILTIGSGELLGWSPLFSAGPMTATATALEATCALSLSGARLRELCETDHELGFRIMRQVAVALSQRLVATRLQLLDLFTAPA